MFVCVLSRGWHVRVCVFLMWRVVSTYVSYLPKVYVFVFFYVEGGMYVCVLPKGWRVRVCVFPMWSVVCAMCLTLRMARTCVFPMWRVVCTYVSYIEDGMYVYVCFLCGRWYVCMSFI